MSTAYEKFHGKSPKSVRQGEFYVPKQLILLGDAVDITYRCDKWNGGGDGTKAEYIHKFKKGVKLYMDERTGKMLYLKGAQLKVTHRGIIN